MAVTVFTDLRQIKDSVGTHLGHSDWLEITQERINLFADATGDHQWIHVDVEKAKEGPFGAPIAHGYLTLALSNLFLPQIVEVRNISMGVNYGMEKVRFPAPVPVGSRVRGGAEIVAVTDIAGGVQVVNRITVEIEGSAKPACVIDSVTRYLL
ncbi:dehydratase [Embleya scabrispora]|uniref:Dehydratase n=1 Tax=Embleya scabrispora TaxID=159449 RepID=A0A1T3NUD9_9ACTN|nr:MaoC family dehydratase [Embleya scabrispora]OPC80493.1 dehydratase [Embleya scabrispora]